ncbi:hypothetical protein SAMN04488057_105138 [Cyclobacterium lianum]|uniref:Anti-sigma-K factor rskA n=1 Tax=Cyclobacterium lianum TaxID=388280 RepID=A0A1M7NAA3_9BACT|nr:hypothetical protein [Cyclobacterium lianum]SHN00007.1 hypothetical protein SAMN04488057_105138 [Cyclobacterium lianum]
MKVILQKNFFLIGLLLVLSGINSCSTKVTFPVSAVVPAAEPAAKISKNKTGGYDLELNVSKLALPERLSPPKKHYLVWIDTDQGLQKLGELSNNSGIFRNRGNAAFETNTSYRPTVILVTAENDLETSFPGSHVVLKSRPIKIK